MLRRLLTTTGLAATVLVVALPASASTTKTFHATFKEQYPLVGTATSCATGHVSPGCFGGGQIVGYGSAVEAFVPNDDFVPLPPSCGISSGVTTITLADGTGSLTLLETNKGCTPGRSGQAPDSARSYGNPIVFEGSYTIFGGTGVLVGASGSGEVSSVFAGSALTVRYDGTLTLP